MSVNYPEEIQHLAMVEEKLHNTLIKLDNRVTDYENEYRQAKRYLADNWHEIDSMEKFSNERSITQIENAGNLTLDRRLKIEKLINAPYFARIDFQYDGEDEAEAVYIGPCSFTDNNHQILIYDWRAPISSVYYDYELERASFKAPAGTIEGDVVRKRQFKINSGQMEYVLESAINIGDDILQRELSTTSDQKMKNIIATIQKDQNQIIRNDEADILIIQGVAGSGKTSIALHRVAYLLYRYKEQLSADDVVIISPNKVFADYISNVLPELGEEPILELSFEDIAARELLGEIGYERLPDQSEKISLAWTERYRFKSTLHFINLADQYLNYASSNFFAPQDYSFGPFTISANFIEKRYCSYHNQPIFSRFSEIAGDILEQIKTNNIREHKLPRRNEIIKKLTTMFKLPNTLALYTDFYTHINKPEMLALSGKNQLEWPDVFPYLYFRIFTWGIDEYQTIRHLVIDEMQDYTPIQYAVINRIFRCKKTILGDFGQSLNPCNHQSLDTFKHIFDNAYFVKLTKSYRSTYEIIEFAKKIKKDPTIEPIARHGDEPDLICCDNEQNELMEITKAAARFTNGNHVTLGILCKTISQANNLYQQLSRDYAVHLLTSDSTKFTYGITVTTILMSKGLEFDEVLIPFADCRTFSSDADRNLLYVACTRAMHKLSLTYCQSLTRLLSHLFTLS